MSDLRDRLQCRVADVLVWCASLLIHTGQRLDKWAERFIPADPPDMLATMEKIGRQARERAHRLSPYEARRNGHVPNKEK